MMPPLDTRRWQSHGPPPPQGGVGPPCPVCGVSRWVELGGGQAKDVHHPNIDRYSHPNVDIVADLETNNLPFHDGHATRIKAIHSLQHLSRDACRRMLRECYRVLVPGGQIYIMINDMAFLAQRMVDDGVCEEWLNSVFHDPTDTAGGHHKWGYSFETMKAELEAAGFVGVDFEHFYNRWEFCLSAVRA